MTGQITPPADLGARLIEFPEEITKAEPKQQKKDGCSIMQKFPNFYLRQ